MELLIILILLFLISLNILLCKYNLDLFNKYINNKKKYSKSCIIIFSIFIFMGSTITIFMYKISAVIAVFLIYVVGISFIIYLLNFLLKRYKWWSKIYLILPILFSFMFTLYGFYNMKNIVITKYEIHNSKIKNDYKVVLIADLHYGVSLHDDELTRYSNEISKLNPDFVVLAGDIVDERTKKEQMINAFKILGSINTKYGIYYTYGNHDKNTYTSKKNYTIEELQENITNNNITILSDEKEYINNDILIIGRNIDNKVSISNLIDESDKDLYVIVVDHIPLEYKMNRENGVNLELSGHTHNGQIFPLGLAQKIYNKFSNNEDSPVNNIHKLSDMVYGKYEKDDFVGIVTSGIAGWSIPIRTESRSEYVLINLSN